MAVETNKGGNTAAPNPGQTLTGVPAAGQTLTGIAAAAAAAGKAKRKRSSSLMAIQSSLPSVENSLDEFIARANETLVDGEIMQSGTTADMLFSVGELIAFTSRHVTLRPGDLILTGTPDGVGLGRTPPVYMKPGSTVTVRIDGLCSVTNPIVDSSHRG